MIREVLVYPDPELKQVSAPIREMDAAAARVAQDLLDTMLSFKGCVGLAAPQIGLLTRAVVFDVSGHKKARSCHGRVVLFNPDVILSEGSEILREGCLSLPDLTANVRRATDIAVRGIGQNGEELVIHADAFEARVILHEMDHLDGYLFLDRVASLKHDIFQRKVYK